MPIDSANNGDFVATVTYHLRTDVDVGSNRSAILVEVTIGGVGNQTLTNIQQHKHHITEFHCHSFTYLSPQSLRQRSNEMHCNRLQYDHERI